MVEKLDSKYVKDKIKKYLEEKGPSLPVHIAKHMSMNSIFASAFLSEMAGDGMIKISDMKVGGSPLYYTPEKVPMLENFTNFLGSKEREACLLLKEKGILEDTAQTPVIRVALRSLKDFAIPFKKDEKLFWRYFTLTEDEVRSRLESPIIKKPEEIAPILQKIEEKNPEIEKIEKMRLELEEERKNFEAMKIQQAEKNEQIIKKSEVIEKSEIKPQKKSDLKTESGKKPAKKQKPIDDKFLNEVKSIAEAKGIALINIESFDKKEVFARIRIRLNDKEYLLAAYDKKKVDDKDILKAYKKASLLGLEYYILSKGDTSKKTKETIEAYKKLASIDTIIAQKSAEIE